MRWHLSVVWVCVSPVTSDAEHLFLCSLATHVSFRRNVFQGLRPWFELSYRCVCGSVGVLYTFWVLPPFSDTWFANVRSVLYVRFSLCGWCALMPARFQFACGPIYLFLPSLPVLLVSCLRNDGHIQCLEYLSLATF